MIDPGSQWMTVTMETLSIALLFPYQRHPNFFLQNNAAFPGEDIYVT
jgi:hypothetical protein